MMKADLRASVESMYRRRSETPAEPRPQTAPDLDAVLFEIHQRLPRNKGGGGQLPEIGTPYRLKTECGEFIKRDCVTTDWTKATCPKCRRNAPVAPAPRLTPAPRVAREATKGIILSCYREHGVWWHGAHLLVGCKCCHQKAKGRPRCGSVQAQAEFQSQCQVCSTRSSRIEQLKAQ